MKKVFKHKFAALMLALGSASSVYWGVVASDKYVSSANVIIQAPDVATKEVSIASILPGGVSQSSGDLLLLRDYLLSTDVLLELDERLALKSHYSGGNIDFISRLTSDEDDLKSFQEYFHSHLRIELDEYSGVLKIDASAFDSEVALQIVQALLVVGESKMNEIGQRLAKEQVVFIESQVQEQADRLARARTALLDYQNSNGVISPVSTIESLTSVVSSLSAEKAKLKAERRALRRYQSAQSQSVMELTRKISALDKQIAEEESKLTAQKGLALNQITSDYEQLKLDVEFAQELYANSLTTLESARMDSVRKLKSISVLQTPVKALVSNEPNRLNNAILSILIILIVGYILKFSKKLIAERKA